MNTLFRQGIFLAILSIVLDQWSKWAAIGFIKRTGDPIEVTEFFTIYTVWNKGVSFGMFNHLEHAQWIFSGLAIAVSIVLLFWLRKAENMLVADGLGLVIGGAIGNTIDRIRFGAVIDFLDFHLHDYHWPSFNIADTAIFLGVVALLWDGIFRGNKKQTEENIEEVQDEEDR